MAKKLFYGTDEFTLDDDLDVPEMVTRVEAELAAGQTSYWLSFKSRGSTQYLRVSPGVSLRVEDKPENVERQQRKVTVL